MKKMKQPGENISLKTKKTEDPAVMEWINAQTNLMDSLRYLIEMEIAQHGVRNLQMFIPAERNVLASGSPRQIQVVIPQAAAAAAVIVREEAAASAPAMPAEPELPRVETVEPDDIDDEDIESWL